MSRAVRFVKAEARGNDFLLIEEAQANGEHAAMARALCARHTGVGADGIEFYEQRQDGTWFLRLFNADGSEAELSGNGTRCVAAWLMQSRQLQDVTLATHGGPRPCTLVREEGRQFWIRSEMGIPRLMELRVTLGSTGEEFVGVMVNVGNPHFVLFPEAEDFSVGGVSWQQAGERLSVDPAFRFGTNVEFVRVHSPEQIEFRIFERGCGPTESSGTGTCAASAAAIFQRACARELFAVAPGGEQQVSWPRNDQPMLLTGPASILCTGEAIFG